ncbi:MAG: N-acetyltransferase [Abitibacteriaceae bacterium]|nr:N-acetyltransferase [Abditibacteriaceae bacterium]
MIIRPETPADKEAVRYVNEQAFGRAGEADLVEALHARQQVIASLVAVQDDQAVQDGQQDGQIVGHILFSPVVVEAQAASHAAVALGPLAVLPQFQGQGIGSALVRRGLEVLRQNNYPLVVVLGHPEFYPRFGFSPASAFGIGCQFQVPDEVFMLAELSPGAAAAIKGTVVYPPEFNEV